MQQIKSQKNIPMSRKYRFSKIILGGGIFMHESLFNRFRT